MDSFGIKILIGIEKTMTLLEKIKNDRTEARLSKSSVKSSLLTTLVGEIENYSTSALSKGKTSNQICLEVLAKFLKNNLDFQSLVTDESKLSLLKHEASFIESYLPKLLTDEEILSIINSNNLVGIGPTMKFFKENYFSKYDPTKLKNMVKN